MKKIVAALIIAALIITGAVIIFNNSRTNTMYRFVTLLQSEHYYLDGSYSLLGIKTPFKLAVNGDDFDLEISTLFGSTRVMVMEGNGYLFNEDELTVRIVTPGDENIVSISDIVIDYDEYEKTGEGKAPIPGFGDTSYSYFEYTHIEDDLTLRYYFNEDNELYCIYSLNGLLSYTIIIDELTEEIPGERLRVPGDYEEI